MTLHLSDARYARNGAYPVLKLKVNGRETTLSTDAKPTTFNAGYVFLGSRCADLVPAVELAIPADDDDAGGTVRIVRLDGFTNDPHAFRLYSDFLDAANSDHFVEGPVAIPA